MRDLRDRLPLNNARTMELRWDTMNCNGTIHSAREDERGIWVLELFDLIFRWLETMLQKPRIE